MDKSTQPPDAGGVPGAHVAVGYACQIEVKERLASGLRVVASITNGTDREGWLLHTERMPYVLLEPGDHPERIVAAWSIQPLPMPVPGGPVVNYGGVAIPTTRPIAAGQTLHFEAVLRRPIEVSSHLRGPERYAGTLPAQVQLVAEFGLAAAPVRAEDAFKQSYRRLAETQRTCRSAPVTVDLGAQ